MRNFMGSHRSMLREADAEAPMFFTSRGRTFLPHDIGYLHQGLCSRRPIQRFRGPRYANNRSLLVEIQGDVGGPAQDAGMPPKEWSLPAHPPLSHKFLATQQTAGNR